MELTSSSKHSGSLCSSPGEKGISRSGKSDPANSPAWSSCSPIAEAEAYRMVTIGGRELRVPGALFEKYEPLWTTLKDDVVLTLTPTNDKARVIARLYDRISHDRLRIPDAALRFVVPLMLEAGVSPESATSGARGSSTEHGGLYFGPSTTCARWSTSGALGGCAFAKRKNT